MWWNRRAGGARAARRGKKPAPERRRPAVETLEDRLAPALLTVNSLADVASSSPTQLTLRDAVNLINSGGAQVAPGVPPSTFQVPAAGTVYGVGDTIIFDSTIAGGTIALSNFSVGAAGLGTLVLTKDVTIQAPGPPAAGKPGGITITKAGGGVGESRFTLFRVAAGVKANLNGADPGDPLTLTGAQAGPNGPLPYSVPAFSGAAVENFGTLIVSDATFTFNTASANGGAIFNEPGGTLTVNTSTFYDNTASMDGGAIYNQGTATLNGISTAAPPGTPAGTPPNSANLHGGAIFNDAGAVLTVNGGTLTLNTAQNGGAIYNLGMVTLDGSTVTGNSAVLNGGGIVNDSGAVLVLKNNSNVSKNNAGNAGGGIDNQGSLALFSSSTTPGVVTIDGSQILNDNAPTGGGVENLGTLTVTNGSTIAGNNTSAKAAALNGGGVDNNGPDANLTVKNSSFAGNFATSGGGLFNGAGATAAISSSTFSGNSANQTGGGLTNSDGTLTILRSTFDSNSTALGNGGALENTGSVLATVTINASTFSNNGSGGNGAGLSSDSAVATLFVSGSTLAGDNSQLNGGGLAVQAGSAVLFSVTVTNNRAHTSTTASHGGGVFVAPGGTVVLNDTVVAKNFNGPAGGSNAADDVSGALSTASAANIVGDGTRMTGISNGDSNGNQVGVTGSNASAIDPLLAPLGLYGGGRETAPPLPGSPAIDAGARVGLSTLSAIAPATASVLHVLNARPFIPGMTLILADTGGGAERVTIAPGGVDVASETLTLTGPLTDSHLLGGGVFPGSDEVGTDLLSPPGNQVDIGAFESHGFVLTLVSGSPQQQAINTVFAKPLVVSVTANNPAEPVTGGAVRFTAIPSAGAAATFSPNPVTIDALGNASGIATADGFPGTYTVKVTSAGAPTINLTLTNAPGLSISPLVLAPWTLKQPGYNQALVASNGQAPDTFTVSGGTIPSGLKLTSNVTTGALTGTPIRPGTFTFTITVTDSLGAKTSQDYAVTINPPIAISAAPLATWTRGQPNYNASITATGGTGPLTFGVSGPTDGLTLDPTTGTLSGTPTLDGTFTFNVTATDTVGATSSQQLTLVINPPPALALATLPDGLTHLSYAQALAVTGGTGALTFSTPGPLPPGLSLNPATGAITGTPTAVGTFNFVITVTDSVGATSAPQAFTLAVDALGSPGHQLTSAFANLAAPSVVVGTGSVTLSGKMVSALLAPTGTVTIHVGGAQLSAPLRADGSFSATLPAGALLPGQYPITYTYAGDQFFLGTSGSTSLSVGYNVSVVEHRTPGGGKHTKLVTLTVVLKDAHGTNVSSPGLALTAVGLSPTAFPGVVAPVLPASRANRGGRFQFKRKAAHGAGYVLSLKTRGLFPGVYGLMFLAGTNPAPQTAMFVVT